MGEERIQSEQRWSKYHSRSNKRGGTHVPPLLMLALECVPSQKLPPAPAPPDEAAPPEVPAEELPEPLWKTIQYG